MSIKQVIQCDRCKALIDGDVFYEVTVKSLSLGINVKSDFCRACGVEVLPLVQPGWNPQASTGSIDGRYDALQDDLDRAPQQLAAPPPAARDCKCSDWTIVGHPAAAYWPDDDEGWPTGHHPNCQHYVPPPAALAQLLR